MSCLALKYKSNDLYLVSLLLLLVLLIFSGATVVFAATTLEVEDSIVSFENLFLEAIETSYLQSGTYTDVLAGYFWSPVSSYSFAAKYIDGINSWYKYMVINNTYMYNNTMFSDVYDYIFVGSIYGVNRSSGLIAKLDPSQGGIQCYNVFDSARYSNTKLSAVGYNYKLDMMVAVGATNFREELSTVQVYSLETYGLVVFFDKTNCSLIGQYRSSDASWFTDVIGINDPSSTIYGYTIMVGYTLVNSTLVMPYVIFVDANQNVQASIVLDFHNSTLAYATSVDFINNSIIIGGTYKTFDRQFEGFIAKLDVNIYNITNDWTLGLTSYGNDSISDVYTGDDSLIAITGYIDEFSNNSTLVTGKLDVNGTLNSLFTYGINNTSGKGVATGPPYKLHVVGTVVSPYPNSIVQAPSGILQNITPPTIMSSMSTLNSMNNPIIRQANLTMIDANPVIDYIIPPILGGLYIVIGEDQQQNNSTETTTTTTTTTTLTTITSTGTLITPTSTYTPVNVTVTGPGTAPQFYCIDISTGTNLFGIADSPGTLEDPFNDYPDWIVTGNTLIQPRVTSSINPWPMLLSSQARWISAYTNPYGQPLLGTYEIGGYNRPPTTYRIEFTIQVPSILNMTWTADNVGTLFIDGNQVQTSDFTQGLVNYSMNLLPGTHSIKVVVEDFNLYTGLYVSGAVCPITPEQTTISRPTTTTITNVTTTTTNTIVNSTITSTVTVTVQNEPCECTNNSFFSIAIIGGIAIIGLIASYLIAHKK